MNGHLLDYDEQDSQKILEYHESDFLSLGVLAVNFANNLQ